MGFLQDKVAWVTGAGSGIGQAVAVALAGAGATVVISGRREAALAETAAQIEAAGGLFQVAPLDVREGAEIEALAASVAADRGRLDILVNNAGVNTTKRHWAEPMPDEWDEVLAINVSGLYRCTAAVLPTMRRQQDGLIVNIASWAGKEDFFPAGAVYSASKRAVLALNASLNIEECRNGIRACAICPAEVATPIMEKRPVPVSAEQRAKMLQPEDLAQTVLYVAAMPPRACVNEIVISPTLNRPYLEQTGG